MFDIVGKRRLVLPLLRADHDPRSDLHPPHADHRRRAGPEVLDRLHRRHALGDPLRGRERHDRRGQGGLRRARASRPSSSRPAAASSRSGPRPIGLPEATPTPTPAPSGSPSARRARARRSLPASAAPSASVAPSASRRRAVRRPRRPRERARRRAPSPIGLAQRVCPVAERRTVRKSGTVGVARCVTVTGGHGQYADPDRRRARRDGRGARGASSVRSPSSASLSTIGPVVSADLVQQAVTLILVGSIGILCWITFRFNDVKFGRRPRSSRCSTTSSSWSASSRSSGRSSASRSTRCS